MHLHSWHAAGAYANGWMVEGATDTNEMKKKKSEKCGKKLLIWCEFIQISWDQFRMIQCKPAKINLSQFSVPSRRNRRHYFRKWNEYFSRERKTTPHNAVCVWCVCIFVCVAFVAVNIITVAVQHLTACVLARLHIANVNDRLCYLTSCSFDFNLVWMCAMSTLHDHHRHRHRHHLHLSPSLIITQIV